APGSAQMAKLLSLPGTPVLGAASDPAHFTFVVAGDNRPHHEEDPPTATIRQIFAAVKTLQPAFVVSLGDTIYGKNPQKHEKVVQEYKDFLAIAGQGGVPVFNAPGNHEMDDQNDVPNQFMQLWYGQSYGLPYGAFTYGNSRFVVLNSEEMPPPGVQRSAGATAEDGKKLDPGYVGAKQLELLRQELDANKDKAHIFVFMHHPIRPRDSKHGLDAASAKAITDLFKGYANVSFVLAAHEHLFWNPQDPGNVKTVASRTDPSNQPPTYLVAGGAGAPIAKKVSPAEGGFHHYLVFKVAGDRIDVQVVKLEP
ncbi:MAG: metallophosphoesterase, partial [Acidobacteriota bacterium]|nr:metallophosphoesterase [Acidobacteriota bacterium]